MSAAGLAGRCLRKIHRPHSCTLSAHQRLAPCPLNIPASSLKPHCRLRHLTRFSLKQLHACSRPVQNLHCRASRAMAEAASESAPQLPAPATVNGVVFRQLFDADSSTYTYIVGDPASRQALLIDPVLEQVERDLQVLDEMGLTLVLAANTHCHADHITGSGKIKSLRPGVRSAISAASGAAADVLLQPHDSLTVGGLSLACLPTPGHTDGCMSFHLAPQSAGAPGMVFTGDALLIRGCGRTDFQQGDAGRLYDSVHSQLLSLPADTLVFPAHDYRGRTASTVGEEAAFNARLTKGRAEFVQLMAQLNLPKPKQIDRAVPANLECGLHFPYA